MTILDIPVISRIRRNHGLEHATITILSRRMPSIHVAGYSFPGGFLLLGEVPTEQVREVVMQALLRMNNGERRLAVHPNCGTNLLTAGFLAGVLGWLGMAGAKTRKEKAERLPAVIALSMLGILAAQPLGPMIQERITTSGDPQGLTVVEVFPVKIGRFTLHRVVTQG